MSGLTGVITSSYTPCLVSTDPTLTPDNLTTVLEIVEDRQWRIFADYINLPTSEEHKIMSQHIRDKDCKLALPHVFISAHPAPSWELVAHALYQMGKFHDSGHKTLEYLQQHFPTGTLFIFISCADIHVLGMQVNKFRVHVHVHVAQLVERSV